ncbi:hypothetical protein FA13DRAFT_1802338 [Coprinellus micaceus]|uniref:Fungal-type protein kinase domain-containing protein n=1 Tax=Coprinellus micaceus TaxID=71717 RepID=A0A4Y7SCB0_COPMI|nr:hypothetical protein FA13DRAFT_1802338 [Coprinellus micaceus]
MPYQFGTGGFYQPNEPPHTPIRDNAPRSPKAWVSEDTSDDEGEQQPGLKHQFIPRQALPAEFHSSNNHEVPPASIGVSGLHSSQQYPGIDTTSVQSSGRAYATVIGGTPYRKNPPPRTHPSKQSVKDHAALLMQAQGDVAKSVEGYYLNQFGVVPGLSTAEIMPWLSQEANQSRGVFINGHWNVPQDPPKENLLYEPFEAVLNSILEKFVKPHCGPGVSRRVIDTHGAKVRHGDGHFTSPDLLVRATGASFDAPLTNFGYGDVATFFELKLDGQLDEPIHIHQMVVYARQVYAHQPNRKFVRGLLLSDKRARLVHYDHSGVQVSPPININERPPLFVRIVVGLCNGDESFMGFDDSIQWEHDICNRKISGTLTAKFDKDSEPKRYHLRSIRPIANVVDIRGRATTCWAVRDNETGEDLIVKDSWDSDDRPPEYLRLTKVKGAQGVCEIVWHSSDKHPRFETRLFRCAKGTRAGVHYYNRVASRIIMKAYGKQIHHFRSILELLHALRDAIAGHSNVFGKEIVHRDISNMNVLLGREDAEVQWRAKELHIKIPNLPFS